MGIEEQDTIVGRAIRERKESEYRLSLLRCKADQMRQDIERVSGLLNRSERPCELNGRTFTVFATRHNRQENREITWPEASEIFDLIKEIESAERELSGRNTLIPKV